MVAKKRPDDKPIFLRDYVRYNALGADSTDKQTPGTAKDGNDQLSYQDQQAKIKAAMKDAVEDQGSDSEDDGDNFFSIRVCTTPMSSISRINYLRKQF